MKRTFHRRERGVTMLVVLVLLSVMLLGGLALARLTEVGTLATGNAAYHEAALQASELGVNDAFTALKGLGDEDTNTGSWYWATEQPKDSNGLPTTASWSSAPSRTVGSTGARQITVNYVVERVCSTTPVTDTLNQCLVRQTPSKTPDQTAGTDKPDPPNSRQFRVTVRVSDSKGTETYVQALVTKGKS